MSWPVSAFATSLSLPTPAALAALARIGFTHVDLFACEDRPAEDLEALAEAGLLVACPSLIRGIADGEMLDAPDVAVRRDALDRLCRRVADAARLGATCAYLIPGRDASPEGLARFADGCVALAGYAAGRMVRLLVEPVPGRALPRADDTLRWLGGLGTDNLGLVLDMGHCLITAEDPAECIRQAGPHLGHVHLDDNNGKADLHQPLLAGRLQEGDVREVLGALREIDYRGALSLEYRADGEDPERALREGKALVERLQQRMKDEG
jgi:sugar phosphate isomerase/epimerase